MVCCCFCLHLLMFMNAKIQTHLLLELFIFTSCLGFTFPTCPHSSGHQLRFDIDLYIQAKIWTFLCSFHNADLISLYYYLNRYHPVCARHILENQVNVWVLLLLFTLSFYCTKLICKFKPDRKSINHKLSILRHTKFMS